MKTKDAVNYFGSKTAVAKNAGVSRSRVSQWGDDVPELQAYRLERASNGDLKAIDYQETTSAV